jgi:peptidoglycan/xylan/chitin deacetylase (PgdA/CDA1 family)/SAM-dependent methyltransferase
VARASGLKTGLLAMAGAPAAAAAEASLRRTALRAGVAFVYHGLADRTGVPGRDAAPPHGRELFQRHLAFLAARCRIVPASGLAAAVRTRRRGERFPASITFDDDLASHAEVALPLLEHAGVAATFFLGGGGRPEPEEVDVERIAAAGHEIGFHTRRHPVLTELGDEELAEALADGRGELAAAAGRPVELLAYPFGVADERVAAAARSAGYRAAFTVAEEAVTPASDPLLLPRVAAPYEPASRLGWHATRALRRALAAGAESGSRSADARRAVAGETAGRAVRRARARPRVGSLDLGDLRTTTPVSRGFGFERGTPLDRHYIERFLEPRAADVRGRVLEIGEDRYTRRFGGERVRHVDVLHVEEGNPQATIVGDLADLPQVPDASYDCVICTQTLLLIWDAPAAVATLRRILAPGGVALVTVPGITRVCREEAETWGDYWRFTAQSAGRLFEEAFGPGAVEVEAHGNVLTATAQLHGIAAEELEQAELDARDPDFEVLIGVRAQAPSASTA